MNTVTATFAKQNFGTCVSDALREPLVIEKSGRPAVVMLSYVDFQRFQELEDAIWLRRAEEAAGGGYSTPEETESFLKNRLEAIAQKKTEKS